MARGKKNERGGREGGREKEKRLTDLLIMLYFPSFVTAPGDRARRQMLIRPKGGTHETLCRVGEFLKKGQRSGGKMREKSRNVNFLAVV